MKTILQQLAGNQPLTTEQAVRAFELIMSGQASPAQTAALLSMIQMRGPCVDEIVGAARVMRDKVTPVEVPAGMTVVDTCGTGGDHGQTFNISTAAAIVAAGAARPHNVAIAKHGNRSVTSRSGSSQVLEALGVKLQVSSDTITRCLDEAGLCFCFAPAHHPAMKHAAPVRAELGFRTIFNILGPLTNPAGARRQVIGVFQPQLVDLIAHVLLKLNAEHAMVVHGRIDNSDAGLDEISTAGITDIATVLDGRVDRMELDCERLNLPRVRLEELQVDGPETSAQVIRGVLRGEGGPARDIVAINAAAALVVADITRELGPALELAHRAIDNGDALRALESLVEVTQADATAVA